MSQKAEPTLNKSEKVVAVSVARRRATMYIARGEVAFLFFTAVSVALHPGFVLKWNEGGMSNYGLHVKTAVPYTLALLLLALYSRRAALLYTGGDARTQRLRYILTSYSWVVLLVLLSSYIYSLNDALKDIHYALGTVLIILVGTASFWMFQLRSPLKRDWLFLIIQLSGDVVALLTSLGDVHLLFLAEILANVGFASFLVRTSRWVPAEEARKSFSRGVGGRS